MTELTRERIEQMRESMKEIYEDDADELCNLALSALEGEEVWFIVNSATGVKELCSDENEARAIQEGWGSEWTVRRFRLVPVEG